MALSPLGGDRAPHQVGGGYRLLVTNGHLLFAKNYIETFRKTAQYLLLCVDCCRSCQSISNNTW